MVEFFNKRELEIMVVLAVLGLVVVGLDLWVWRAV
jgi:hypothetical protein